MTRQGVPCPPGWTVDKLAPTAPLDHSLRRGPTMNGVSSRRSFCFFGATVLASLTVGHPSHAAPGDEATEKVFVGYVFGEPHNINFRLYTHLCHAFLTADGDGNLR